MTLTEIRNMYSREYVAGGDGEDISFEDGFDAAIGLALPEKFADWLSFNEYKSCFRGWEKDGKQYTSHELWLLWANDEGLIGN